MAKAEQLAGNIRTTKAQVSRHKGYIPAVMYGQGLASKLVEVESRQFTKVLQKAGFSSLVNLKLNDDTEHTVIIRDIQYHPMKSTVIHADFYQVRMDQAIEAKVPLRFIGESPAVKDSGGVLVRNLDEVDVEALPADMPHDIEVDISLLKDFETSIRVADITIPKGVTVRQSAEDVIALVQAPRSEQELESLAEEVKEDVEAVEGVKKPEPVDEETAKDTEDKKA